MMLTQQSKDNNDNNNKIKHDTTQTSIIQSKQRYNIKRLKMFNLLSFTSFIINSFFVMNLYLSTTNNNVNANPNQQPPPPPPPPMMMTDDYAARNDNNRGGKRRGNSNDDYLEEMNEYNDNNNRPDRYKKQRGYSNNRKNDFPQRQQQQYQMDDYNERTNPQRRKRSRYPNYNDENDNSINFEMDEEDEFYNNNNGNDNDIDFSRRRSTTHHNPQKIQRQIPNTKRNEYKNNDDNNNNKMKKKSRSSFFSFTRNSNQDDENENEYDERFQKTNQRQNNEYKDNRGRKGDENDIDEPKEYVPINYQFPSNDPKSQQNENDYNLSSSSTQRRNNNPSFSNARKDAITRYASFKTGKIKLALSSTTCGALFGGFIGKSILGNGKQLAILFGFLFWFMGSFLRNAYGEMVRSIALGLIYLLNRTRRVRRTYKTGKHLKAICRIGSGGGNGGRDPFPPVASNDDDIDDGIVIENPWKYVPQRDDDPDFDMIKSMICIVIVGSFCGGNVPLLPTWIGSTAGAATFAFMAIGKNARGDLLRTMGMRLVATLGEAIEINNELDITAKVSVVVGKLLDKALILDRKHRIKDKLFTGATWVYDRISSTINNVQEDLNEEDDVQPQRRDRREYQRRRR